MKVTFWDKLQIALKDRAIRRRVIFVLGALAFFRLLSVIPIPGVDIGQLQAFLQGNQFFGLLNIFSGGGLAQVSILMVGVGAYITSTIIMQLLTVMSPKLKTMYHEEGEIGRKKFTQISRLIAVPIAFIQGFGLLLLLSNQGIMSNLSPLQMVTSLFVIVGGAMLIMWIGELMTEFGIGNGISILIFAGIIAVVPAQINQLIFTYDPTQLLTYIGAVVIGVLIVAGVVLVTEAERSVPITYAKQSRGGQNYASASNYLPIRINQSGVMPLIFAISILLFPQMIANFMVNSANPTMQVIADNVLSFLNNGWLYAITYFVLVFLFTYFYTAITFDAESVSINLQKSGAFIPGVRPGKSTEEYLGKIVSRTTLIGATFLSVIAVLPIAMQSVTGIQSFAIGGTALLIVVAVIIDLIKKVDSQIAMRQY